MIVRPSDFKNEAAIAGLFPIDEANPANGAMVRDVMNMIEKHEPKFMGMFGSEEEYEMYDRYNSLPIHQRTDATKNRCLQLLKESITNYIAFRWHERQFMTPVGAVTPSLEDSTRVSPMPTMVRLWNEMVENNIRIKELSLAVIHYNEIFIRINKFDI